MNRSFIEEEPWNAIKHMKNLSTLLIQELWIGGKQTWNTQIWQTFHTHQISKNKVDSSRFDKNVEKWNHKVTLTIWEAIW